MSRFIRRLRGTHAVRVTVEGERGVTRQVSFAYAGDPGPLIDELARRCGGDLERYLAPEPCLALGAAQPDKGASP